MDNNTIKHYEEIVKQQEEDNQMMRNGSGCYDLTAYVAIKRADEDAEKKRRDEEYQKRRKLIDIIYKLCDICGYHIEERIVLKDKETGKIWR